MESIQEQICFASTFKYLQAASFPLSAICINPLISTPNPSVCAIVLEAGRFTASAANNQDVKYIVIQEELETVKKYVWDGFP